MAGVLMEAPSLSAPKPSPGRCAATLSPRGRGEDRGTVAFLPGDVGLVEVRLVVDGVVRPRAVLFGAIRTASRNWAVKAATGLCVGPLDIVAAWRLPGTVSAARLAQLAIYLRAAAEAEFRFGEWDCGMMVANWVRETIGRDPGADLRGRYATRQGWMREVRRAGGMEALYARVLGDADLVRLL